MQVPPLETVFDKGYICSPQMHEMLFFCFVVFQTSWACKSDYERKLFYPGVIFIFTESAQKKQQKKKKHTKQGNVK